MNLKNGKVCTSKFVGTGPSSYEKRIYRTAVSQRLRDAALESHGQPRFYHNNGASRNITNYLYSAITHHTAVNSASLHPTWLIPTLHPPQFHNLTTLFQLGGGVGTSKHSCLVSYFIMLTTTCLDHCGSSSGHKNLYRENYMECDHSIGTYSKLSTRSRCRLDYTYWAKVPLLSRV